LSFVSIRRAQTAALVFRINPAGAGRSDFLPYQSGGSRPQRLPFVSIRRDQTAAIFFPISPARSGRSDFLPYQSSEISRDVFQSKAVRSAFQSKMVGIRAFLPY